MRELGEEQTSEGAGKGRFQFGLKHLVALPVGVALFIAIAGSVGLGLAILILWTVLGMGGMFFSATRRMAILALAALVALMFLLPLYSRAGPAAFKVQCRNNLKQIVIALHNYHDVYGSFPPAYIADEDGRPMHSWRVLILPYLEYEGQYEQYDFNEPWNGPNNRKLADDGFYPFFCPPEIDGPSNMTNYVAVLGCATSWPGSQSTCLDDFTDATCNTILVVEVANSGIHWMEPRDLHVTQMAPTINRPAGQGISSFHVGGANVAFVDGSVRFLPDNVFAEDLRAMLTRSGDETVDDNGTSE